MKKLSALALTLALTLSLAACSSGTTGASPAPVASTPAPVETTPAGQPVELTVFAAASMTDTLQEIAALYAEVEPNVKLVFNFDSSGTLKTQIEEGAACDLFLSAGQKQMDQLDAGGLDLLTPGTRMDLLENRVTLAVPAGNPKGLTGFDDLARRLPEGGLLMAMGNSDVPVGQYTQKILGYYGLDEAALAAAGALTYGSNVKEVTTQVDQGSVDCGVIYCTDAFSAGLEVLDYATAEMCGQVIYPAAVLKQSAHPDEAQAFLTYLSGDEALAVFQSVGFSRA